MEDANGGRLELEHHQLDLRYEHLRLRREAVEQHLLGSLSSVGQQVPIVVVAGEAHRYRVIDGFHRIRALARLGEETVWATLWELADVEALLLDRGLRSASETAIEQAWLLAELVDRFGLEGEELSRRFDRSASWVSRRLALVRVLPEPIQGWVREGRISGHSAMRHLVPLARAKPDSALEVASAVARQRLTCREVGRLIQLLARVPRQHRPRILADPKLALRAGGGRVVTPSADWLIEIESLAERIEWLIGRVPALHREERGRAVEAIERSRSSLEEFQRSWGEE